jgi:hypothetical protein
VLHHRVISLFNYFQVQYFFFQFFLSYLAVVHVVPIVNIIFFYKKINLKINKFQRATASLSNLRVQRAQYPA